jgi:hypothetical protein
LKTLTALSKEKENDGENQGNRNTQKPPPLYVNADMKGLEA